MRLRRFEIHNFKCIEYVSLEWEDLLVLIGENNAGKSSVLSDHMLYLVVEGLMQQPREVRWQWLAVPATVPVVHPAAAAV